MARAIAAGWVGVVVLALGVVSGGAGCRAGSSGPRMRAATQPAAGRPETCPDDAIDPYGDGTPGPMDLRCSYADTTAGTITRIRGRVELQGGLGTTASPGRTEVIVYEAPRALDGPLGPAVAHATSDPQGSFSVGAMLRAGEYVLVVPGRADGRPLAQQRITVGGEAGHTLHGVRLLIPADPALADEGEAQAPAPTP